MSLIQTVTALIEECGSGTADDILPNCTGATRDQVKKALQNASQQGLLEAIGQAEHVPGRRAKRMSIYASKRRPAATEAPRPPRGTLGHMGRITSVFALGGAT